MRPLIDGIPTFERIGQAIQSAHHSIWLTVAFFVPDFRFPCGGSLFDVLDRAVERGLDVRILFWRPNPESAGFGSTFAGTSEDREMLRRRESRLRIRWDRAHTTYCQHQKCWIVDAGHDSETAFIGGINLSALAMESPGHKNGGRRHDVYLEITGPSATDVAHNFVQRWNGASERNAVDGVWCNSATDTLRSPDRLSPPRGSSVVQIQRMVAPALYTDDRPAPGASRFPIGDGERSILDQYFDAIDAAQHSIYIENQALPVPEIAKRIERAVERGVEVVLVAPAEAYEKAAASTRGQLVGKLRNYRNFTLASLSSPGKIGERIGIYVHSKLMLVDDEWATVGSCNLHRWSLNGHTEMNAAIWDKTVVKSLRCRLLSEHLAEDVTDLDDRQALRRFRDVAMVNSRHRQSESACWQGLAVAMLPPPSL